MPKTKRQGADGDVKEPSKKSKAEGAGAAEVATHPAVRLAISELTPASPEDIKGAEEVLGLTLPSLYAQTAGLSAQVDLAGAGLRAKEDSALGQYIGGPVEVEILGPEELKGNADTLKEWEIKIGPLVLIAGDGHFWFALDYRSTKDGDAAPVVFYETDEHSEPQVVAKTYRDFIALLRDGDDGEGAEPVEEADPEGGADAGDLVGEGDGGEGGEGGEGGGEGGDGGDGEE